MEVVEIVVYIGIAVIIGGFVLTFLLDWDVQQTFNDVKSIVFKEHDAEVGYRKVDKMGFVAELHHAWQDCGFGMLNKSVSFYVSEDGELTKEEILEIARQVRGAKRFKLQNFSPENPLDPALKEASPYSDALFLKLQVECEAIVFG